MNTICNCGRPARYTQIVDGMPLWFCNKRVQCKPYETLERELKVQSRNLRLYVEAINKIDDYFEYQYRAKEDRKKVCQILGNLTDDLKNLANEQ